MNILVLILQILLGVWNIIGGIYMTTHYQELMSAWASNTFPPSFWIGLGVIQILFSLGLIVSLLKKFKKLAPISAIGLAIIDLSGIFLYAAYAGFPGMLWGIIPGILLAFVAYYRGSRQ